jgi:hypothetical protein
MINQKPLVMKTLTKWLTPLLMLALALPNTTKAQDLTFGSATATNIKDTVLLGGRIDVEWQLTNDGNSAVPQQERVEVTLTVAGDSVNGRNFPNLPLPAGQSVPTDSQALDDNSLPEVLEASEYSEGDVEVGFIVSNASDGNASNDTFSTTVYVVDRAIDIGVSAVNTGSTDLPRVFHDSITSVELEIKNYGDETLKSGTQFPIENIVEFQQNRLLDTFPSVVSLDEDLAPQQTDTVITSVYASPFADTGEYTFTARTTFGQDPYSVDPADSNDANPDTTTINVKYKYNIEPRFTGLSDGDTILRGSNTGFGIDLFNEGPGFVRSFQIQTQQGTQTVPLTLIRANFGVDDNYRQSTLLENIQLPINLQVNTTQTLIEPGDLQFRLPANSSGDSLELGFYHQAAVPSIFLTNLTGQRQFIPTQDTNRITLYVEDKTFDIGVTNISPVGDTIQPDSTNEFEVTITNFSADTIGSENSIPVTASFKGVNENTFNPTQIVPLGQDLPGNDSVTVTVNLDLTDIAEGEQTLVMETIWSDEAAYGLDNNPDNDADSVTVTVGESEGNPEGIAQSSLVKKVNAYPNPADENIRLSYTLKESNRITVNLVNADGKQVRTRQQGLQTPGVHNIDFSVKSLSAGTYFYQIRTEEGRQTGQVVVK